MKKLSLSDLSQNAELLLSRDQMKKITGGLSAEIICRKGDQYMIGSYRVTRWSCNNSEGDFYALSRLEKGYWTEKFRVNLDYD